MHYPITKLAWGALDTVNVVDSASGKPIPIQLRSSGGVEPVIVDDAAFTPATTPVVMFGAEFDNTLPDSVDEGDAGAVRMSANRNLFVNIRDNAGNERGLNVDASGNITVNVTGTVTVGAHAVTNAGTFAVQVDGAALTALQLIDDPVFTDDAAFTPATSKVMMAGFEFDDTTPDSVDEGDAGAARMSARREIYVQLRDAAGNERGLNVDASGNITVNVTGTVTVGSHAVTNAGTFVVQVDGAALTALQLIDDPVIADDAAFTPATSKVMMAGFEFDDVAPDSVNEGDAGAARMSANRCIYVNIRDNAGNERGLNIDASGNLTANITGSVDTELPAAASLADNTANPTVPGVAAFAMQWDGATWDRWNGEVRIIQGQAGITAGSGAASATATPRIILASDDPAVTSLGVMDDWDNTASDGASVSGDVAHDGVDAGEPVKIGAQARSSEQTAVASADRVNLVADLVGKLITLPYANPENFLDGSVTLTTTSNSSAIAAQAAGVRIYLTSIEISNSSTTFSEVNIKDGTTIKAVYPAPATSGAVHNLPVPLRGTAATDLNVNAVTAVTSLKVSVQGYKGV